MIQFKCHDCGEGMEAPSEMAGQSLRCPNCGAYEVVPSDRVMLTRQTQQYFTIPSSFKKILLGSCSVLLAIYFIVFIFSEPKETTNTSSERSLIEAQAKAEAQLEAQAKNRSVPVKQKPTKTKQSELTHQLTAELSNLTIDIYPPDFGTKSQLFDVILRNISSKAMTVYVVIYARNDKFSPPRRGAWPFPGTLFWHAKTNRAQLSYQDIMNNWDSKPDDAKGYKITIPANWTRKIEGLLPINEICLQQAWRGKPIDSRANYEEWNIWVFSERGKLVFNKETTLKLGPF